MPQKPKKVDLVKTPSRHLTTSHVLTIWLIVFGAIIVVGGAVFAFEWRKLQNENNGLEEKIKKQNTSGVSEFNEAANNTGAENNTANVPSNTTKTDDTAAQVSRVKVFLVAVGDEGKTGEAIGCGDSLVAVSRDITPTTKPLEAAMKELLSLKTRDYGESGLITALYQSNLTVKSVAISNGTATVKLSGTVTSGGTCDDPRIVQQLKATALQFTSVKKVDISINEIPLDQLF